MPMVPRRITGRMATACSISRAKRGLILAVRWSKRKTYSSAAWPAPTAWPESRIIELEVRDAGSRAGAAAACLFLVAGRQARDV